LHSLARVSSIRAPVAPLPAAVPTSQDHSNDLCAPSVAADARASVSGAGDIAHDAAALFDAIPAPMWVCDVCTLRVLAANDAACALSGVARREAVGATLRRLWAGAAAEELLARSDAEVAAHHAAADGAGYRALRQHRRG